MCKTVMTRAGRRTSLIWLAAITLCLGALVCPEIAAVVVDIPDPNLEALENHYQNRVPPPVEVDIPDPNLEAAIRLELVIPVLPLTDADLATLGSLDLTHLDISNLTGLEYATNLWDLNASENNISDLSPLAGLTDLQNLTLYWNAISDITPLAGLSNLMILDLWENQVTDTGPLAGLTDLFALDLAENQITNISPLAGLTSLEFLDVSENQITDISALAGLTTLEILYLGSNQITDVSALAGLTNLTDLDLESNQITDIGPLASLTALERLYLPDNQITDIGPLASLTALKSLYLGSNQIIDIGPLASLKVLMYLYLESNQITDVGALADLIAWLGEVYLEWNPLGEQALCTDIPDVLEWNGVNVFTSLSCGGDYDGDGLADEDESGLGTDPFDADSDRDGLSDLDEIYVHYTNPRNSDTDGDGLDDYVEIHLGTNPHQFTSFPFIITYDSDTGVSTDVPKPILNLMEITSVIEMSGAKTLEGIADVDVTLDITHTHDHDLVVSLESPFGTVVQLFANIGGSGDNFTNTILDDQAATPIHLASAPFTGRFRPEGNLSAFKGEGAVGTWILHVYDNGSGTGTLNGWTLDITYLAEPVEVPAAGGLALGLIAFTVVASGASRVARGRKRRQ